MTNVLKNVRKDIINTIKNVCNAIRYVKLVTVNEWTAWNLSLYWSVRLGPSEDDCKTCADGFTFNEKERKCLSLCTNGNYFDKNTNVSWNNWLFVFNYDLLWKECKICTDNCLECLYPGSYCRQCVFPMSLDTVTHRCLNCCPSNKTTNDCCQCPLSWDGK